MVDFAKDPLISFVVPVYKVPKDVLKRCLMSLDDQDYPNMEIICVFDGVDPELVNVAVPFLKDKKFKVLEIEHAGACAARNAGFNASSGEIVSFFNSDYIAKPGMVRMWVKALQDNPDCGFVYGAYEYTSAKRMWYPSKPFDPFLLTVANFIDCGFPLWRKYVVEWDVNCKSLQDWDFWLRVVFGSHLETRIAEGNVTFSDVIKGHYLGNEVSFMAEPPRAKGLSDDSHSNWKDRVHYVKSKNSIPEPEMCVSSVGAPVHGVEIAKMISADYRDDTIYKPHDYKALYLIGWYMKPSDQGNEHPNILMAFDKPGIKKIIHFVGADIFWLRKFPYDSLRSLAGALKTKADHILCETRLAQFELAGMGIDAEIVPIPSYNQWELRPLTDKFSVAIFLTAKSDFDKYCYENTISIVRAMPDVQFMAYGDAGKDLMYPNLKHVGNLSREKWQEFVYQNSAYIRLVRHDTLPMASCEFLMAGRDVISNIPHEYVEYIDTAGKEKVNSFDLFQPGLNAYAWPDTKKKIIQRIRAIRNKLAGNHLIPHRIEASEFYMRMLDKKDYIAKIRQLAGLKDEEKIAVTA